MKNFNNIASYIAIYLICINIQCYGNFIDDYCWRDYDGIVPEDALKAGMDRSGDPIYIGQTLFENKLIPGKIHHEATEIHIEFHTVHILNETMKILCTEYPEKFEWFKTEIGDVLKIKDKHVFEGGYEKGYITYVGRALSHGEMTVGKVVCSAVNCFALTTIEEGKWYQHDEFEILTYNPDVEVSSPSTESPHTVTPSAAGGGGSPSHEPPKKPSFWTYFLIFIVIAALIVLVVVLVRRC